MAHLIGSGQPGPQGDAQQEHPKHKPGHRNMAQKRTKRTTISRTLADKFAQKLEQLPEKKKTELTPKELIFENSEQLDDLLERGYDYDDLVALLKDDGINLSKATLRQYLREARKARTDQDNTPEDTEPLTKQPPAKSDQEPAEKPESTAQRSPKKLGKSRLQSDENPTRYPGDHGQPIEMKTDL